MMRNVLKHRVKRLTNYLYNVELRILTREYFVSEKSSIYDLICIFVKEGMQAYGVYKTPLYGMHNLRPNNVPWHEL